VTETSRPLRDPIAGQQVLVLGGGEVGLALATAATTAGATVIVLTPRPTSNATQTALRTGFRIETEADSAPRAARIWVCTPAGAAAEAVRSVLTRGCAGTIVADLSSSTAAAKAALEREVEETGGAYVDVAIMGSVTTHGAGAPLWASGAPRHVEAVLAEFAGLGATTRNLGPTVGHAAAVKLLRSVLTKGLEGLALECLLAAHRLGVLDDVTTSFADVDASGFGPFLEMLVTTHRQHAPRRTAEIVAALDQVRETGLQPYVLVGAERRFETSAAHGHPAGDAHDLAVTLAHYWDEVVAPDRPR